MQKPIASLMAVGLLLLAACSTAEVEPGPITSFEDIAGTTYDPAHILETRFEGTKTFLTQIKGPCGDDPDAIYEIHLLENGNLQFAAIEDPCGLRSGFSAEWAPVP